MKRMLFNATHQEELRVAIVDGQRLLDLDIESSTRTERKGNIYNAVVTRVEPSLEAAFVDYGTERQGFLSLKEISRTYFTDWSPSTPMAQVRIQDVIKEGQELLVQVEKDERGSKGAALTTFISLAGRFLVLMPNNPKGGGISRRIEGEDRSELRENIANLEVPQEHAIIARTAGIGKSLEELQWDFDYLLQLWNAIAKAGTEQTGPFLVYQESNLVVRAIRDYLRSDIAEIIIDDDNVHQRATRFMQQVMPQNLTKLKRYEDTIPLFSRFQIEHQIEAAFSREVRLASGGAIIIDHTEAIVTIDVNSARATKGADIEETALQTNLEAVDEVARQLRIRDLGGLIVIDLIDMNANRNQRTVESRLNDALKADRARVQVGRISRFGLLEMSRQRLRTSLGEANYLVCPRCAGSGTIRSVPSSALSILRILEEEALKENTEAIHAHLPVATATYLLNEKRHEINLMETRLATRIVIIPTDELDSPHFRIKRIRSEDLDDHPEQLSHEIGTDKPEDTALDYTPASIRNQANPTPQITPDQLAMTPPPVQPAAAAVTAATPATGLLKRLWKTVTGEKPLPAPAAETEPDRPAPATRQPRRSGGQGTGQRRSPSRSDGSRRSRGGRGRSQGGRGTSPHAEAGGNRDSAPEPRRSTASAADKTGQSDRPAGQSNRSRRSRGGRGRGQGGGSRTGNEAQPNRGPARESGGNETHRAESATAAGGENSAPKQPRTDPPATPADVRQAQPTQPGTGESTPHTSHRERPAGDNGIVQ